MLRQRVRRYWAGMLLVGALATLLVAKFFPGEIRYPNDYLNAVSGDSIKNYFVFEYYTHYDSGQLFTGMNYPRGEHINYPDMQPLLAVPLAWARQLGLPLADYGIGLVNLGLLLALVVTAVVLYVILYRLCLPVWYAGLAALLITFMAPQIDRFQGHMSLAYACFVPIQWYCIIRMLELPTRRRWYLFIGVFNLLVGLLTAYHLAIGSFLLLGHIPVLAWQRGWRRTWPLAWRMFMTAVLPLLAFRVWLGLTDPITDRPSNPYGLLTAHATFRSVFAPGHEPLKQVWQFLFETDDPIFEGQVYVGVVGLLILLCTGWLVLRYLRRGQWRRVTVPVLPTGLRTSLWAAALVLVAAMAMPLRLPGFSGLTEYLGPLKQFRALGRFAWPFYYIFSAYAAFYIYRLWRYLRQHRAPGFATSWLLPLLLLWGGEAVWYVRPIAENIESRSVKDKLVGEYSNYQQLLGWSAFKPTDFQAILPLPYFIVGTDKIDMGATEQAAYQSYKTALNLHLPLLTMFMARSSVSETLRLTQLLSSSLVAKTLLPTLPSAKPILLVVTPETLRPAEQRLVSMAQLIRATPEVSLYALPISALAATTLASARTRAATLLPTLTASNGLYTSTGKGALHLSFDQSPDRRGRLAPGAFYEPREKFSTLYAGPLPMPADTGRYEASVWVNATTAYGLGNMQVKLYHDTEQLDHQVADARISTEIQGDWIRVAVVFRRPPTANRIEVLYDNHDLLADDLLIRPLTTDVYWLDQHHEPVLNGYPLAPTQ